MTAWSTSRRSSADAGPDGAAAGAACFGRAAGGASALVSAFVSVLGLSVSTFEADFAGSLEPQPRNAMASKACRYAMARANTGRGADSSYDRAGMAGEPH